MTFWDKSLSKHRDYEHGSFSEHEFANGGRYQVVNWVMCDKDPVTERLLSPSEVYYWVDFTLHTGQTYVYLVPSEPDNSAPNKDLVGKTIDDYAANPVPGGRSWADYVDFEETPPENLPGLDSRNRFW